MNDFPDKLKPNSDLATPSFARTAASFVLMLIGVGAIVGTCILFFYLKAYHVEPFPSAWRLLVLIGMCVSLLAIILAMLLAGSRMVVRFGSVTLVVGIGMLAFGFVKLAEPSLRFYAPLGFFVSLAGGFLIWSGLNWTQQLSDSEADLKAARPFDDSERQTRER
jgi:hypothetical protein